MWSSLYSQLRKRSVYVLTGKRQSAEDSILQKMLMPSANKRTLAKEKPLFIELTSIIKTSGLR